jgi:hypothetical protein
MRLSLISAEVVRSPYTVTSGCQNGGGTGSLSFNEGNLNVIAVG